MKKKEANQVYNSFIWGHIYSANMILFVFLIRPEGKSVPVKLYKEAVYAEWHTKEFPISLETDQERDPERFHESL